MWIMLSDAFLSIVAIYEPDRSDNLLVRARVKGDIERVFPGEKTLYTPKADYAYRAVISVGRVGMAMTDELLRIDYPNFKNSVTEKDRHDAYLRCWGVMADFQAGRAPRKKVRKRRAKKPQKHLIKGA